MPRKYLWGARYFVTHFVDIISFNSQDNPIDEGSEI